MFQQPEMDKLLYLNSNQWLFTADNEWQPVRNFVTDSVSEAFVLDAVVEVGRLSERGLNAPTVEMTEISDLEVFSHSLL